MFTIANDQLEVQLLDPVADEARMGARYCTGGYIFQINDAKLGPLLAGATYPDSFNVYDGQGIPDAFNLGPHRSQSGDPATLVLGTGMIDFNKKTVTSFCTWSIARTEDEAVFTTQQSFENWSAQIVRTVSLLGRTVRSRTVVKCTGQDPLGLRWFPHPFWPYHPTGELCKLNGEVGLRESAGYDKLANGFIERKNWPWDQRGYYLALDLRGDPRTIASRHPVLGLINAQLSYSPTFFPIWGNRNTWSWEPFYERSVSNGQTADWWIDYDF